MKEKQKHIAQVRRRINSGAGPRIVTILFAGAVIFAVAKCPEFRELERSGLFELSQLGGFAPLALVLGYVASAAALMPVFPLDMAAGAHFDFWAGVFWVQVAATTASAASYFAGGHLLRQLLLNRLAKRRPQLRLLEAAVADGGWRIVFLTRLSPVFPFSLLGGFYGAVGVPFFPYIGATFLGMLPGTALFVYAGDIAGDLSGSPENPGYTEWQWWVQVVGFAATAVLILFITRRAQQILGGKLTPLEPSDSPDPSGTSRR